MKLLRSGLWLVVVLGTALSAAAQLPRPKLAQKISWSHEVLPASGYRVGDVVTLRFTARIVSGFHVYSAVEPNPPGPTPTSFELDADSRGAQLVGPLADVGKPHTKYDEIFETNVGYFEGTAVFTQKVKLTAETVQLVGGVRYQVCDSASCIPGDYTIRLSLKALPAAQAAATPAQSINTPEATPTAPVGTPAASPDTATTAVPASAEGSASTAAPVSAAPVSTADRSLWGLFFEAFAFGLIGLLTPCVYPMIPFTVSYFTKNSPNRATGIRNALIYSGSIVFIFVALGLAITAIFGSTALYQLASNPWVNLLFFAMLVFFALSFLGWFEITLPSRWSNAADSRASQGGVTGTFFMALTLVLVSFSCTGPLAGGLIIEAARGSYLGPTIGMLGFSLAFALPFGLFALFPGLLNSLPKSGGWLNSVKITLGILELGLALKFLSNADLVWHLGLLDREIYLAAWIVLAVMLGLYFLGKLTFPHDSPATGRVSVPRFLLAVGAFWFALYLVPGLWGAPLRMLSGFLPPVNGDIGVKPAGYVDGFGGTGAAAPGKEVCNTPRKYAEIFGRHTPPGFCVFYDLEEGLAYARRVNKPVFLDFTGHSCVNCRHMEANVWPDAEVKALLTGEYVMISLYVDDRTPLPKPIDRPDGRRLRTIGDQWLHFQETVFNAQAQPYYVLLDPARNAQLLEGKPAEMLVEPRAHNTDVAAYRDWLRRGLAAFKKK